MTDIIRCNRCILPASLPSVKLNRNGVCSHCIEYERRFQQMKSLSYDRMKIFESLLHQARKRDCTYDCLIPLSGGKDSTYALYICAKLYGMRCLAVTFDNGYLSVNARENINHAVEVSGADHIHYTVNRITLLKLYKIFLERCGSFCPVCMRGIGLAIDSANKYNIPLIVSGTGFRVAYLAMIPELYQGGDPIFFRNVIKGSELQNNVKQLSSSDSLFNMQRLLGIARRTLRLRKVAKHQQIGIYDYFEPELNHVYDVIQREMRWIRPEGNAEHMDCLVQGVANYIQTLKFSDITPKTIYNSGQVRFGRTNREAALKEENYYLMNPKIPTELDTFLREIDMDKDSFYNLVRDWRKMDTYRSKKLNSVKRMYHKISGI